MWRELKLNRLNHLDNDIRVRLAMTDDAKLICDYFTRNRDYLQPWEPVREKGFYTEKGWQAKLIKLNELHLMSLGFYCLILSPDEKTMFGTISFSNVTRFPLHGCNVGYSLDEQAQGKGIMRRALKIACDWMFDAQNIHRISAGYMPKNHKSESVLQAAGFEKVGFAKDYLLINGNWEDHNLVALINSGWEENKQ